MRNEEDSQYIVPPAEGERRAVVGFYNQYRVSASLILRSLRDESLQWIRLADPEAGRLDDFQLGTTNRVDAFQIKWAQYGGNFTFRDLTSAAASLPSLINQLADGWKRLRKIHPTSRVVVHFVTNELASVSDRPPVGDPPPTPCHFAAFLEQAWEPFRTAVSDPDLEVPEPWRPTWDALRVASRLPPQEFKTFVQDCELEFNYHLPEYDLTQRDHEFAQRDLERLTQFLFETVADPERPIELNRDRLLTRLDWKNRYEYKSSHFFPVDENLYQPVEASVHRLEQALSSLSHGYVAVLGTPGSGKSTLLTQTLRHREERLIRYYAYVPDAQDPVTQRGESTNFLHDVVLEIERAGFRIGKSASQFDRDQLLERFYHQLQQLSQDWESTGRKTVILIDGLDHIGREQRPIRSLLLDLFPPERVPEGVLFVLGSQTDQLDDFPDRVQQAIRQPDRRIEMQSLSREAVLRLIDKSSLPTELSNEQEGNILGLSEGHPLALMYLLNRLKEAVDANQVDAILETTEPYGKSIEDQYHSYWRQVGADHELSSLFALLARLRGAIDLSWVESWAGRPLVDRLRSSAAHYFKKESYNRWYFFHNSFRLFLKQRTIETEPGVYDYSREHDFHCELAEKCSQSRADSPLHWEELYHLALAEEHKTVLEKATQEWFRNQCLALRPLEAIQADIRLAYRSATALQDPVAVVRLELAGAEVHQRQFYLVDLMIVPLLLKLGKDRSAVEHVRDGNRLRVSAQEALQLSQDFLSAGLFEEARRIFELAEPHDILTGSVPIEYEQRDNGDLLDAWVGAAINFRPIDQVIGSIQRVRQSEDPFGRTDPEEATKDLRNWLLLRAGLILLNHEKWEDLTILEKELEKGDDDSLEWWFWLQVHSWRHCSKKGDKCRAKDFFEKAQKGTNQSDLTPEALVAVAECVYRILGDEQQARELLKDIPQPELKRDAYPSGSKLQPFLQRFRLNRLLYALGDQKPITEIVPDASDPHDEGLVYFERSLCIIARIWAEAWRGRLFEPSELIREADPILRLFNRSWKETNDWLSWYKAKEARGEYYTLLVQAVCKHSVEAAQELRSAFEQQWEDEKTKRFWPSDVQREIILFFKGMGTPINWVKDRLRALEIDMFEGKDISERVSECLKQAEAWFEIGDDASALRLLQRMYQVSFGVGYKHDYQLNTWIRILDQVNKVRPELAAERISWLARALAAMEWTSEEDIPREAANELLEATFRWSPRKATQLFCWLLDRRISQHEEAFRVLLHASLKNDNPSVILVFSCVVDLLLPFATDDDPKLAALLIDRIAASHSEDEVVESAKQFLGKLEVFGLNSTRTGWQEGVARTLIKLGVDPSRAGLDVRSIEDRYDETSSRVLKLQDGSSLTTREVTKQALKDTELIALLDGEETSSYFNWVPVILNIVDKLDIESIQRLAEVLKNKDRASELLGTLSERLSELGDSMGAWELGQKAFELSRPQGWSRNIDGGSRLAAIRALVCADPVQGRSLLYETLEKDGGCGIRNFEEVLPLLVEDVPILEIWGEIEKYLSALFEGYSLTGDGPSGFEESLLDDTPERAISDLIVLHLDHPTILVAQATQRLCVKLLLQGNTNIQEIVSEALNGTTKQKDRILMVLDAVSLVEPTVVYPFRDKVASFRLSPNFSMQRVSQKICERIGCEPAPFSPSTIPLPEIYRLSIPSTTIGATVTTERDPQDEPLVDIDDPVSVVRPLDKNLESIAKEARLPTTNLLYRALQIMKELSPEESWLPKGEESLRSYLTSVGLRFPFIRPRVQLARQAMFHIIHELASAGVLGPENLRRLESRFHYYDPFMFLVEPTKRPSQIEPPKGLDDFRISREEWLNRVEDDDCLNLGEVTDRGLVFAEETTLLHLDWERTTEIRRSAVYLTGAYHQDRLSGERSFFPEVINHLVEDYPNVHQTYSKLRGDAPHFPFVIQHLGYGYDSPGNRWLALNPTVGYDLGWTINGDGLFKWVDNDGKIMAESIWWADGPIDHFPYQSDEVGAGWLVVINPDALEALQARYGQLKRQVVIERSYYRNGDLRQNHFVKEEEL